MPPRDRTFSAHDVIRIFETELRLTEQDDVSDYFLLAFMDTAGGVGLRNTRIRDVIWEETSDFLIGTLHPLVNLLRLVGSVLFTVLDQETVDHETALLRERLRLKGVNPYRQQLLRRIRG